MDLPEILYEDNHIIAVNKPARALVQSDITQDEILPDVIKAYIKEKYSKPGDVFLGVVHRLDRPVSGVVLFARTSKALARLNDAFKHRQVEKTYWALTNQAPPKQQDTLKLHLAKNQKLNKSWVSDASNKYAKSAELEYTWLASHEHLHLLKLLPHTGRHHQIRVMLAHINCPIVGDTKYNGMKINEQGIIYLHARRIELMHPVKKDKLVIEAPLPDHSLWTSFRDIR